jgi:hypothetical protein
MSIEAMKQALEACKKVPTMSVYATEKLNEVEAILGQAIEQAEKPEPVVTRFPMKLTCTKCGAVDEGFLDVEFDSPPPRQPLTDEEIGAILDDPNIAEKHQGNWLVLPYAYARAIEAKLKEKNT